MSKKPRLLVLVRHGESLSNKLKENRFVPEYVKDEFIHLASHDVPLTLLGEKQAFETGKRLEENYGLFDYVYSSPFKRTRQTTQGIFNGYGDEEKQRMHYRENLFIRERDAGYAFSMTKTEVEGYYPWLKQYWDNHGNFYATPPGGESIAKVVERVYQFIGMLLRRRSNQKLCIVTHGGTIRAFRMVLEHWTPEQAENYNDEGTPINCGVTTYSVNDANKFILESYNKQYWS